MPEMYPPTLPRDPSTAPTASPTAPRTVPPKVNPNRGLAIAALSLGGVALLFTIAMAATSFSAARDFEAAYAQGVPTFDVVTAYDFLALPWFIALLIAWVLTALWLGKARTNVANIRPGFRFRRSAIWDWLGWIIPIVSFWFPHQIAGDLSKGSSPAMKENRWVGAWWAAWIVGAIASQAGDRIALTGDGANAGTLPLIAAIHAIAWTIAFALWVRIVMSIVRDQEYATATR